MLWLHFTLSISVSIYNHSMLPWSIGQDLTPRTPSKLILKSCGCYCSSRSQWDSTFQTLLFISTIQMRIWYSKVLLLQTGCINDTDVQASIFNCLLTSSGFECVHFPEKEILYFDGHIDTLPLKTIQTSEQITGRCEVVFASICKGT